MKHWTDEETAELHALRADGLSCSEIAERIGRTRNSVIGQVYRSMTLKLAAGGEDAMRLEQIRKVQEDTWYKAGYSRKEIIKMFSGWPTNIGYAPYSWTVGPPREG